LPLLADKVCIVSGAAGSIGLATVRLLLREGAKVMMLDLRDESLKRAARDLPEDAIMIAVCDVANAGQVKAAFDATVAHWDRLDVIFSNAGNQGSISALADASEDEFDLTLAIHATRAAPSSPANTAPADEIRREHHNHFKHSGRSRRRRYEHSLRGSQACSGRNHARWPGATSGSIRSIPERSITLSRQASNSSKAGSSASTSPSS